MSHAMLWPFLPSILAGATTDFVERSNAFPFMTQAYAVRLEKRAAIPAPTHAGGTGRPQTVTREANPRYWRLIRQFGNLTGVPVVLNTSFNDNEPIVCRPEEAIECFLRTKMPPSPRGYSGAKARLVNSWSVELTRARGGSDICHDSRLSILPFRKCPCTFY